MSAAAKARRLALIRAGALACPLLVAALVHGAVIAPVAEMTAEAVAGAEAERDLARRYAAIASRGPALAAELATLEDAQSRSPRLLSGNTPDLALASLQEQIASTVREAGGAMRSASGSIDAAGDGLERITATIQFGADIETLAVILHRIETGMPLLFIERLSLGGQVRPENGALVARRVLDVSLGVTGYRLARGAEGRS